MRTLARRALRPRRFQPEVVRMPRANDPNPRPQDRHAAVRSLSAQLEALWRAGIDATPEDVCDDPELLAHLRKHLAGRGPAGAVETVKSDPHRLLPPTLPPAGPAPGSAADAPPGFVIEGELGEGTFGVVYRARQPEHGRTVALKTLRLPDEGARREALRRFHLEARALGAVRHPNVIRIFDSVPHGSRHVLVLEYLPGGTLGERLADGRAMDPRAAAALVEGVARGAAAIHAAGIVHRDLKPGNILFDDRGRPKVADFGLAKFGDGSLTLSRATVGTPAYMSPEQARGEGKHAGPPADVWSLGVILYECLTGRRPFDSDGVYGVLIRVIGGEREPLRSAAPGVPRELERIVDRCLQPDPAARYPTATELADALHAFLAPAPAPLPPPPDAGLGVRAVLMGVAFGFVVALLGAAIFELAADRRLVLVPSKAEVATANELADARQQLADARADKDRLSADVRRTTDQLAKSAAALQTKSKEYDAKERERAEVARTLSKIGTGTKDGVAALMKEIDVLTAERNGLRQASTNLTNEREKFAAAFKSEQQARGADAKRHAEELEKVGERVAALFTQEREALKKEREKLERTVAAAAKERDALAADLQAKAAEVAKLSGEKATAERERDDARKRLATPPAPGPVAATPLRFDFVTGKADTVGLPAPHVEVLPPPGFAPKDDPGRPPAHREFTYKGAGGVTQTASLKVERNRIEIDGPLVFGVSLVRVRPGAGGPAAYYQLFQPEVLTADRWPAEKPAIVNKDVRFEFALGKLAEAGASDFLKELLAPTEAGKLVLVPGAKVVLSLNGQKLELQSRADNPVVFETQAGRSPAGRLELSGGKVVVTATGAPANAKCQVAYLELGRPMKWPDGAVTVMRVAAVVELPPLPPKK